MPHLHISYYDGASGCGQSRLGDHVGQAMVVWIGERNSDSLRFFFLEQKIEFDPG